MDLGIKIFQEISFEEKFKDIEILGYNLQGKPIVTPATARALTIAQMESEKVYGKQASASNRGLQRNAIGYKRNNKPYVIASKEYYFKNRIRSISKGNKKIFQVVVDYRAIQGQDRGKPYTERITVFEFEVDKGKPKLIGRSYIGAREFVEEFRAELDFDRMKVLRYLIDTTPLAADQSSIMDFDASLLKHIDGEFTLDGAKKVAKPDVINIDVI